MGVTFAIPFSYRILHHEMGTWQTYSQAFYHTYLELYFGNGFLATAVYMLLALTFERFISVCHPSWARAFNSCDRAYRVVLAIPMFCFLVSFPKIFEDETIRCETFGGEYIFQKRDNLEVVHNHYFIAYNWFLQAVFRICPTIIIVLANILIISRYRRVCEKRTQMTLSGRRSQRKIREERRLILLLLTTSILFLVCVSPSV